MTDSRILDENQSQTLTLGASDVIHTGIYVSDSICSVLPCDTRITAVYNDFEGIYNQQKRINSYLIRHLCYSIRKSMLYSVVDCDMESYILTLNDVVNSSTYYENKDSIHIKNNKYNISHTLSTAPKSCDFNQEEGLNFYSAINRYISYIPKDKKQDFITDMVYALNENIENAIPAENEII